MGKKLALFSAAMMLLGLLIPPLEALLVPVFGPLCVIGLFLNAAGF